MGFGFPVSPVPVCFSNYFASEGKDMWLGKIPLDSVFIFSIDSLSRHEIVTYHEQVPTVSGDIQMN